MADAGLDLLLVATDLADLLENDAVELTEKMRLNLYKHQSKNLTIRKTND